MDTIIPSVEYKEEFQQGGVTAAVKAAGAKESSMLMVPIDKLIVPAGFNVRIHDAFYEARIDEVANSIVENGFFKHMPLAGYAAAEGSTAEKQNFIYVCGGFTRLAAAKRAIERGCPIEMLPVVLQPPGTSMADLNYRLFNDNTGAPLQPYEKGIVIKRALGYGEEEDAIIRRLDITKTYFDDLMYLHTLPASVQKMVVNRQTSAGNAIKLSRQVGPAEAAKALADALADAPQTAQTNGATPASQAVVTPRAAQAAAGVRKPNVQQQLDTAIAAIKYAIALPGDVAEFLGRWINGDKDAVAEVAATVPKKVNKKAEADKKRKAKEAEKKKKADEKAKKTADRATKKAEREQKAVDRAAKKAAAELANVKDATDIGL